MANWQPPHWITTVYVIFLHLLFLALVLGYNVWSIHKLGPGNTVSDAMAFWGYRFPIIPCLVGGLLIGLMFHWWFPVHPPR